MKDDGLAISPEKWKKVMERNRGGRLRLLR